MRFQSLFYWNLLSYKNRRHTGNQPLEFQSLFYWNLLSYSRQKNITSLMKWCFNPCFTGTSSHTRHGFCFPFPWRRVSILVLLEPPLIRKWRLTYGETELCFNPCFTGTSSHTLPLFHLTTPTNSVSILVLLEPPLILAEEGGLERIYWSFNPCFTGTSSHTRFSFPS